MKRLGRRKPSGAAQARMLEDQGNRCYWCCQEFGSFDRDTGAILRPVWDHYVPVSAGGSSCDSNFVASCQLCNSKKASITPGILSESDIRAIIVDKRLGLSPGSKAAGSPPKHTGERPAGLLNRSLIREEIRKSDDRLDADREAGVSGIRGSSKQNPSGGPTGGDAERIKTASVYAGLARKTVQRPDYVYTTDDAASEKRRVLVNFYLTEYERDVLNLFWRYDGGPRRSDCIWRLMEHGLKCRKGEWKDRLMAREIWRYEHPSWWRDQHTDGAETGGAA